MEKSIFKYIIRYSARQQLNLTLMAILSFPVLYIFYELPKQIINGAIQGNPEEFPQTAKLFGINLGFETGHVQWLIVLCLMFLLLVVVNQGFKYVINVYKGLTGERMLRRLRFDLYSRVLRFPRGTFRNMSQGEIIPMITAEVEPLGGFIGDAYAQPIFQGGQLLVILGFLFAQNPFMAAAAVARFMGAEKLMFLSDVPGIFANRQDSNSLISHLDSARCRELIADGTIDEGMLPKVDAALEALDFGVKKVHIVDACIPHSMLLEIYSNTGIGTEIVG